MNHENTGNGDNLGHQQGQKRALQAADEERNVQQRVVLGPAVNGLPMPG
jgi:hypothetical protein